MDPATIAALIAGGTALVGTLTNNWAQKRAIERQNEYNAPKSQMARYYSAGLSPNLIYGSGQASAGNQTSVGDYQGVKVSTQDALNMANAILNFKNIDANTRKANAEAQQAQALAVNANLDTEQKQTFLSQYNLRLQQELEYAILRNRLTTGQIDLQTYQRAVQDATVKHINSQTAINNFQLETGLPLQLAISQQNANTAEQNMILANKRFAFDSSFDENINPLNFWNSAMKRRQYHWEPINDISRGLGSFLGGGIVGTILRGRSMKGPKSGGSRGPTYYNSRNYQSAPDYGFYD